jgi:hypothetical protein
VKNKIERMREILDNWVSVNGEKLSRRVVNQFEPPLPKTADVYIKLIDDVEHEITLYTANHVYDGSTGVTGRADAGDWEWTDEGEHVKAGNGIMSLRKLLRKVEA